MYKTITIDATTEDVEEIEAHMEENLGYYWVEEEQCWRKDVCR